MSNNERSPLPRGLAKQRKNGKQRRTPDLRIRRTRSLLSNALVALMQEKSINKITVQEVLDRASVGRSTFYLHFRDKNDLLLSQLETFLATMSTVLIVRKEQSHRVVPVTEMLPGFKPGVRAPCGRSPRATAVNRAAASSARAATTPSARTSTASRGRVPNVFGKISIPS